MESSISTQPSTIETSETSHATSLEVSSIITGVSSEPLTIVSESGGLNSTEIASTPVVITSPAPQPLLRLLLRKAVLLILIVPLQQQ